MHNRRNFIRNSGLMAMGGLLLSRQGYASLLEKYAMHPVGLQLYTLGGTIDDDVPGTLKKVADIGYKDVESAFSIKGGYYGMTSTEFAKLTKNMGLSWVSHHTIGTPFKIPPGGFKMPAGMDTTRLHQMRNMPPMKNLRDNYQEVIDEVVEGGVKYLVCSSIPLNTTEETNLAGEIWTSSRAAE